MNQKDRDYLSAVVGELVDIQSEAPTVSTYNQGRTQGSISNQIGDVVDMLTGWLDEGEDERTEPD